MCNEEEIWIDIPGFNGDYVASNFGRVKSLKRKEHRILTNFLNRGYYSVNLCKDGQEISKRVHQLIAMCFLGHVPNGHTIVVDHINNNSLDNRAINLQLVSPRYNTHKIKRNSKSKYVGVDFYKRVGKYRARIYVSGVSKCLGYFNNEIDAVEAYKKALKELSEQKIFKN